MPVIQFFTGRLLICFYVQVPIMDVSRLTLAVIQFMQSTRPACLYGWYSKL